MELHSIAGVHAAQATGAVLDATALAPGLYVLRVSTANSAATLKVVLK